MKRKASLTEEEFLFLYGRIFAQVTVIPDETLDEHMDLAIEIMDHIDPSDTPFIAAALATENDGIWSDDKHFRQQDIVKVWTTEALLRRRKK